MANLDPGTAVRASIDISLDGNVHVRPDPSCGAIRLTIPRGQRGEIISNEPEEIRVKFWDDIYQIDDVWIARTVVGNYIEQA